jgi:hypothetical protein
MHLFLHILCFQSKDSINDLQRVHSSRITQNWSRWRFLLHGYDGMVIAFTKTMFVIEQLKHWFIDGTFTVYDRFLTTYMLIYLSHCLSRFFRIAPCNFSHLMHWWWSQFSLWFMVCSSKKLPTILIICSETSWNNFDWFRAAKQLNRSTRFSPISLT